MTYKCSQCHHERQDIKREVVPACDWCGAPMKALAEDYMEQNPDFLNNLQDALTKMGADGPHEINEIEAAHKRVQTPVYWFPKQGESDEKRGLILTWIGQGLYALYGTPTVLYIDPADPKKGKMLFSPMEN